jgi:hypothetical protein
VRHDEFHAPEAIGRGSPNTGSPPPINRFPATASARETLGEKSERKDEISERYGCPKKVLRGLASRRLRLPCGEVRGGGDEELPRLINLLFSDRAIR